MNNGMRTPIFISLILAGLLAGCSSPRHPTSTEQIYFAGTSGYFRKAATLRLSLTQAREIITEFARRPENTNDLIFVKYHPAIVGNCYLFTTPRKSGHMNLGGHYVDGFTGAVSFRPGGVVPIPMLTTMKMNEL